jgi:hypothetical protein
MCTSTRPQLIRYQITDMEDVQMAILYLFLAGMSLGAIGLHPGTPESDFDFLVLEQGGRRG